MEKTVGRTDNRWLILISCIIINLCLGAGYAWSVFQGPLMSEFGWTTAQASLAFSISFAMVPVAMIIFGPRQDKEGPRKITFVGGLLFGIGMILTGFVKNLPMLYITYGIILGFGIGMAYGCTTATTVKWFPDKKGLAGGLTAAGFGSGAVVLAPLAVSLIDNYGVLNAFKFLGVGLLLIICAASLVLKSPATLADSTSVGGKNFKPFEMMKTSSFWLLWVVYVFGCLAGLMIIGHAASIASEYINLSKEIATLVVSLVALANTGGRVFWGMVSDKIGRYSTVMVMFMASGLGLLLLFLQMQWALSILGILLIALSFGGFLGTFPGITAENWGSKYSGSNYGYMFTAYGLASIFGPRMAAVIKESSGGDYGMAFLVSILLSVVGIILVFIFKKKKESITA
ncbi:OFA family MFS transporter [Anaerosphaera multitolerans]|uniref:MFS transporter n=1 Tax=Anaerosphaera multitolerans TaxID=2487351 RepID=A0A437S5K0_9FIRM|nr:OFA family MFS transporter [Anaerosphaera multitolerans]RVU54303.1 MFS transporter [Anaerosphaera multitolerans]